MILTLKRAGRLVDCLDGRTRPGTPTSYKQRIRQNIERGVAPFSSVPRLPGKFRRRIGRAASEARIDRTP